MTRHLEYDPQSPPEYYDMCWCGHEDEWHFDVLEGGCERCFCDRFRSQASMRWSR